MHFFESVLLFSYKWNFFLGFLVAVPPLNAHLQQPYYVTWIVGPSFGGQTKLFEGSVAVFLHEFAKQAAASVAVGD